MNTDERIAWFTEKVEDILGFKHNLENLAGTDYFTAPASTNKHHAYEGGLFEHSKKMYEWLEHESTWAGEPHIFTPREAFVIGMFHDLCKVNLYIPNILKSGNVSESKPTKRDKSKLTLPHGERSAKFAKQLLPDLTDREYHYIRWHMEHDEPGWLGRDNVQAVMDQYYPEWPLVHAADLVASYERRDTA